MLALDRVRAPADAVARRGAIGPFAADTARRRTACSRPAICICIDRLKANRPGRRAGTGQGRHGGQDRRVGRVTGAQVRSDGPHVPRLLQNEPSTSSCRRIHPGGRRPVSDASTCSSVQHEEHRRKAVKGDSTPAVLGFLFHLRRQRTVHVAAQQLLVAAQALHRVGEDGHGDARGDNGRQGLCYAAELAGQGGDLPLHRCIGRLQLSDLRGPVRSRAARERLEFSSRFRFTRRPARTYDAFLAIDDRGQMAKCAAVSVRGQRLPLHHRAASQPAWNRNRLCASVSSGLGRSRVARDGGDGAGTDRACGHGVSAMGQSVEACASMLPRGTSSWHWAQRTRYSAHSPWTCRLKKKRGSRSPPHHRVELRAQGSGLRAQGSGLR